MVNAQFWVQTINNSNSEGNSSQPLVITAIPSQEAQVVTQMVPEEECAVVQQQVSGPAVPVSQTAQVQEDVVTSSMPPQDAMLDPGKKSNFSFSV